MKNKKYIVYPGWVESIKDREWRFISARQLMVLYGVHPNDCVIADELHPAHNIYGMIPLRPSYTGDYKPQQPSGDSDDSL